jgi:hypothetical protein
MDKIEYPSQHDLKSPHIRKFRNFMKATGVRDFHDDNFGIWTHPHTGEEHLVLRDAGFDDITQKAYRDTDFEYRSPSSKFHPDEFNAISRFSKLKTKKKEAKRFKDFVKEDWKRAALMGAAATAAGAGTAAAIGFPVVAGAVLAGGQYALSKSGLAADLKAKIRRRKK